MARKGLNLDTIVGFALAIVDEDGAEALTLAAVSKRAGVATPSLYKHIDNLAHLRIAVAVHVINELTDQVTASVIGVSGAPAIAAFMNAYRRYAISHPNRYAAMPQHVVADQRWHDASDRLLRVLYTTLAAIGVVGEDAVDTIRGLRAAVHGFATLEMAGGFQLDEDVERSYRRLVEQLTAGMPSTVDRLP